MGTTSMANTNPPTAQIVPTVAGVYADDAKDHQSSKPLLKQEFDDEEQATTVPVGIPVNAEPERSFLGEVAHSFDDYLLKSSKPTPKCGIWKRFDDSMSAFDRSVEKAFFGGAAGRCLDAIDNAAQR